MQEEERWFSRGWGDEGADGDGGGGGGRDRVGGEVWVGGAVDGHFCRKEERCGSGGDEGVMVTERWVRMGGRDGGRLAKVGCESRS